jgi:hypothetical protein
MNRIGSARADRWTLTPVIGDETSLSSRCTALFIFTAVMTAAVIGLAR